MVYENIKVFENDQLFDIASYFILKLVFSVIITIHSLATVSLRFTFNGNIFTLTILFTINNDHKECYQYITLSHTRLDLQGFKADNGMSMNKK
jgi:hypothetical protein